MVYKNFHFFVGFISIPLLILLVLTNSSAKGIFLIPQKAFAQEDFFGLQGNPSSTESPAFSTIQPPSVPHQHHHHHDINDEYGMLEKSMNSDILDSQHGLYGSDSVP